MNLFLESISGYYAGLLSPFSPCTTQNDLREQSNAARALLKEYALTVKKEVHRRGLAIPPVHTGTFTSKQIKVVDDMLPDFYWDPKYFYISVCLGHLLSGVNYISFVKPGMHH